MSHELIRINKLVAMAGLCSRRDADKLIIERKISVDGIIVCDLGAKFPATSKIKIINTGSDDNVSSVDVSLKETKVWIYNKPCGLVVSHRDELGRKTIFQEIRKDIKERVISVGRLDMQSQGLMILTNDGNLAHEIESSKYDRVYKVKVFGQMNKDLVMQKTRSTIVIEGIKYNIKILDIQHVSARQSWVKCLLNEGKNREIRRIFSHLGFVVSKLIRIKYGPYDLCDLEPGGVRLEKIIKTSKPIIRHELSFC